MKNFAWILFVFVTLATIGCKSGSTVSIDGVYGLDKEELKKMMGPESANIPEDILEGMEMQVRVGAEDITSVTMMMGQAMVQEAKVVRSSKDSIIFTENGKENYYLIEDGNLIMENPSDKTMRMTFNRLEGNDFSDKIKEAMKNQEQNQQ